MKMRNLTLWCSVLLAASFPLTGDSAQETGSSLNQTNSATSASPAALTPAVTTNSATGPPAAPKPPTAPTAIVKPSLPANIALSPASAEVVRMTDANVEPNVILAFVGNSTGTFNLGSSQIIYLRDLGVKDSVITAMMQRDQTLTSGGVSPAATAPDAALSAPQNASAGAPAYAPGYVGGPPAPAAAAPANPPPTVVNNNFYDALSPYGRWVSIDGYGWCWQPTAAVADPGWRPYANGGRWIDTDDGWYWQSDYSWGGTAFHYGRWFDDPGTGWCWWPDNVWAPSWVTWAYNDAYCGWAPLPPFSCWTAGLGFTYCGSPIGIGFGFGLGFGCYNFVPWGGFCAYNPCLYAVGPGQAAGIYGNSTRVNNIINGNGNTIINRGIAADRVSQLSRGAVPHGTIRDVPGAPGRMEPDLVRNENGRTVVYRPTSAGRSTANLGRASAGAPAGKSIAALRQELPGGARVASASASYPSTRSAAGSYRSAAVPRASLAPTAAASRGSEARGLAATKSTTSYWQNNTASSRPAASPARTAGAQYAPSFNRTGSAAVAPRATGSAANFSRSVPTSYWQNNAGNQGATRPATSQGSGRQTQSFANRETPSTPRPTFQSAAPSSRSYYSSPSRSWQSSAAAQPIYSPRYSTSFGGSSYHTFSSPSFSSRPSYGSFGRSFGGSGFSAARSSPSFSGGGGGGGGGGFSHSFGGGGGFSHSSGGGGGRGTR